MTRNKTRWALWLPAAYILVCLLRLFLARLTHLCPTVHLDEFLYYSIARSLATGNGAMMYGQQANYSFFLYPLVLSLAYRFPEGTDYYLIMQIISLLIMNLSLFPIYALGKKVLKDERKAFGLAVISVLLPDFSLCQYLLSENLLYPLFFLMLLLVYTGGVRNMILGGIAGGLMFAVKPGQAVAPFLMVLFTSLSEEHGKRLKSLLSGLVPMAFTAAAMMLISTLLISPGTSLFSVYDRQILPADSDTGAFLKALLLSPYTFVMGCGVLTLFVPLSCRRLYDNRQRILLWTVLGSAVLLMAGTAFVVNRVEYDNPTVHLRYVGMLFPVLLLLSEAMPDPLPSSNEPVKRKLPGKQDILQPSGDWLACAILAAVCVVSLCLYGYDGGIDPKGIDIHHLSISWLQRLAERLPGSVFVTAAIIILLAGCVLLCRMMKGRALKRLVSASAVCLLLLNSVCCYTGIDTLSQRVLKDWAARIRDAINGEDYLYVFSNAKTRYDAALDVNTRKNVSMVYLNDLYNRMLATEGVYEPFVPEEYAGDTPDRATSDTTLLLLDQDVLSKVNLSGSTQVLCSTEGMTLVRITKGERWVDSMAGGITGTTLSAGSTAWFADFSGESHSCFTMDITLSADTDVVMNIDGEYSFSLPAGRDTYNLTIPGTKHISIRAGCEITVHSFAFKD